MSTTFKVKFSNQFRKVHIDSPLSFLKVYMAIQSELKVSQILTLTYKDEDGDPIICSKDSDIFDAKNLYPKSVPLQVTIANPYAFGLPSESGKQEVPTPSAPSSQITSSMSSLSIDTESKKPFASQSVIDNILKKCKTNATLSSLANVLDYTFSDSQVYAILNGTEKLEKCFHSLATGLALVQKGNPVTAGMTAKSVYFRSFKVLLTNSDIIWFQKHGETLKEFLYSNNSSDLVLKHFCSSTQVPPLFTCVLLSLCRNKEADFLSSLKSILSSYITSIPPIHLCAIVALARQFGYSNCTSFLKTIIPKFCPESTSMANAKQASNELLDHVSSLLDNGTIGTNRLVWTVFLLHYKLTLLQFSDLYKKSSSYGDCTYYLLLTTALPCYSNQSNLLQLSTSLGNSQSRFDSAIASLYSPVVCSQKPNLNHWSTVLYSIFDLHLFSRSMKFVLDKISLKGPCRTEHVCALISTFSSFNSITDDITNHLNKIADKYRFWKFPMVAGPMADSRAKLGQLLSNQIPSGPISQKLPLPNQIINFVKFLISCTRVNRALLVVMASLLEYSMTDEVNQAIWPLLKLHCHKVAYCSLLALCEFPLPEFAEPKYLQLHALFIEFAPAPVDSFNVLLNAVHHVSICKPTAISEDLKTSVPHPYGAFLHYSICHLNSQESNVTKKFRSMFFANFPLDLMSQIDPQTFSENAYYESDDSKPDKKG